MKILETWLLRWVWPLLAMLFISIAMIVTNVPPYYIRYFGIYLVLRRVWLFLLGFIFSILLAWWTHRSSLANRAKKFNYIVCVFFCMIFIGFGSMFLATLDFEHTSDHLVNLNRSLQLELPIDEEVLTIAFSTDGFESDAEFEVVQYSYVQYTDAQDILQMAHIVENSAEWQSNLPAEMTNHLEQSLIYIELLDRVLFYSSGQVDFNMWYPESINHYILTYDEVNHILEITIIKRGE